MSSPGPLRSFSEREFYLAEFRGRTLGIAWPADEVAEIEPLEAVVEALVANGSRVVILSARPEVLAVAAGGGAVDGAAGDVGPRLWRALRAEGRAGVRIETEAFDDACAGLALSLRLAKVVWIAARPPVERRATESRVSVIDLAHLEALLAEGAPDPEALHSVCRGSERLLGSIRRMIDGGIPSVNVCAAKDLARELFTYAGAGTFFTRDRYAEVRPLALDDYDLANDLIERGEADGFLAPRDAAARNAVLAHGVGVFIEGRYLAGIGALLPHREDRAVELASLFALTRYVGEGAGSQIVRYAIDRARAEGQGYLFACTTSESVVGFFERHGFVRVGPDAVPKGKWSSYPPDRRDRVRCLRFDVDR